MLDIGFWILDVELGLYRNCRVIVEYQASSIQYLISKLQVLPVK